MAVDIQALVLEIDTAQAAALKQRAAAGQIRALELRWRMGVKEKYRLFTPAFTGRERAAMRDLLSRYPADEVNALLEGAIREWPSLRIEPYLRLPHSPVFRDFYWQREAIRAFLHKRQRQVAKEQAAAQRMATVQEAQRGPAPQKSLTELFTEARRAAQKQKEHGQ